MRRWRVAGTAMATLVTAVAVLAPAAVSQSPLDWAPRGGRSLLLGVVEQAASVEAMEEIWTARRTEAEWLEYLGARGLTTSLTQQEARTLAAYLAVNFPLERAPRTLEEVRRSGSLPTDGLEVLVTTCQSCHSIYPVLLEEKDATGWKGIVTTGAHLSVGRDLGDRLVAELAHYFAINLPVADDRIPDEIKAPLSGY